MNSRIRSACILSLTLLCGLLHVVPVHAQDETAVPFDALFSNINITRNLQNDVDSLSAVLNHIKQTNATAKQKNDSFKRVILSMQPDIDISKAFGAVIPVKYSSTSFTERFWKEQLENADTSGSKINELSYTIIKLHNAILDEEDKNDWYRQYYDDLGTVSYRLKKDGEIKTFTEQLEQQTTTPAITEQNSSFIEKTGDTLTIILSPADSAFCPFQHLILAGNNRFKTTYPHVASSIDKGVLIIVLQEEMQGRDNPMQLLPLIFPYWGNGGTDPAKKQKIADDYLAFIKNECEPSNCFESSLFPAYYQFERQRVPDNDPDKLIDLRIKFLEHLRSLNIQCYVR